ncbi:uncharacterized protein MONBRDRAFT_24643 [Monosiga brevicollis MX1]|uniref:Uncharacterized protein n=1 Tax=Monosiga brevicollis TaxID=81824 RepID=A9UX19_MONBE|nr:uncharacterized protein MONBRDRAFT_24643 [Monosiga brevicollis MX1]EDQ90315.1 predicted protein [Monosiga brevicollis MX1]|eukprot:XP_001745082.1 hypothetical protein [Monosiga brevicollis MX1]
MVVQQNAPTRTPLGERAVPQRSVIHGTSTPSKEGFGVRQAMNTLRTFCSTTSQHTTGVPVEGCEGLFLSSLGAEDQFGLRVAIGAPHQRIFLLHAFDPVLCPTAEEEGTDEPAASAANVTAPATIRQVLINQHSQNERQTFTGLIAERRRAGMREYRQFLHPLAGVPLSEARLWNSAASLVHTQQPLDGIFVAAIQHASVLFLCNDLTGESARPYSVRQKVPRAISATKLMPIKTLYQDYVQRYESSDARKTTISFDVGYTICGTGVEVAAESGIEVQYSWSTESLSLDNNAPFTADTLLKIRALAGDVRSGTYKLYQDLAVLKLLLEAKQGTEAPGFDAAQPWGTQAYDLMDMVEGFVQSLGSEETTVPYFVPPRAADEDDETNIGATILADRPDLDFTEKLWNFVKHASSYDELRQVLAFMLMAVRRGHVNHPIQRGNETTASDMCPTLIAAVALECMRTFHSAGNAANLAAMMRDIATPARRTAECAVELGIFKLQRDFMHHFIGSELATGAQLEEFFTADQTQEQQVEALTKLLNVLEVYVLCKSYLDLPVITLREIVTGALEHFRHAPASVNPLYKVAIANFSAAASQLKRICHGMTPTTRMVVFSGPGRPSQAHLFVNVLAPAEMMALLGTPLDSMDEMPMEEDDQAKYFHVAIYE